ncbi:hypothetical protein DFP73DRAFT_531378 [Morchella snyderi]|nr:hypothetical protein DFP73DRAFT_531378 [Morchella snyderi]
MRYSTITILFSALLAATALAHPSDNRRRNNIDVPEAHTTIDPIDRRDLNPTSTTSSAATTSTTAAAAAPTTNQVAATSRDEDPDFPDETGDRGSVDVPEDDGDDDDDDDDSDSEDEEEKKKAGAGRG